MSAPSVMPLITIDGIAVRRRDRWLLNGLSWRINQGEQWAVVGPNGAGKTTLAQAVAGHLPVVQGKIHYHQLGDRPPAQAIAYIASDARRDLWRQERQLDFSRDFAGKVNAATTAGQLIGSHAPDDLPFGRRRARLARIADQLKLAPLLNTPILAVSTGEMSRILVACQLIRRPSMLILDEPFEGLDSTGRQAMLEMLDQLAGAGLPMLLITHRQEELFPAITHVMVLDAGRKVAAGPIGRDRRAFETAPRPGPFVPKRSTVDAPFPATGLPLSSPPLVDMHRVTVTYGRTIVLDRFSWMMKEGQNWAITGANGAGKSTILKLITGDCLQVYANRIRLFGKDRGRDQTLTDVRRQLGVVSHDVAAGYQKRMTALDVVCSGFFDSVGLYHRCTTGQVAAARACLAKMDVAGLAATPFNHLSQGQRQMVLIARAMVKSPRLLILDEPCSGLDTKNRDRVLDLVDQIGSGPTRLIFVSHHANEIPRCATHRLVVDRGRVVSCGPIDGQGSVTDAGACKTEAGRVP